MFSLLINNPDSVAYTNYKLQTWNEAVGECCARGGNLVNLLDLDIYDASKEATLQGKNNKEEVILFFMLVDTDSA
jgi:hypothetical protein